MVEELLLATCDTIEILIIGELPRLPPHVGRMPPARVRWAKSRLALLSSDGGKPPDAPPFVGSAPVNSGNHFLSIKTRDGGLAGQATSLRNVIGESALEPVLFEAMEYDVYLDWPGGGTPFALKTDVPGLLTPIRVITLEGGRKSAQYRLQIDDDIGLLTLSVHKMGADPFDLHNEIARLEIEVFPRKLDYQRDYRAMLQDIGEIAPALVFEAAGRTSVSAGLNDIAMHTKAEWYEILRAISGRLFQVLDLIAYDPQRRLDAAPHQVPIERARHARLVDFVRATRGSQRLLAAPPGVFPSIWPQRIRENRTTPSFDAEGNRLLRWLLTDIIARLNSLERELAGPRSLWVTTDSGKALAKIWHREIAVLRPQCQQRLRMDWLHGAGQHNGQPPSATLQAHPLYAKALELGRTLLRGLNADAPRFTEIGSRSAATLYEYWCFLAIVNLLRRHGALTQMTSIQMNLQGSRLSLKRGKSAAVTFKLRGLRKNMTVHYNRSYETPTTSQRPDASIHIETAEEIFVFDAKYRLQFDESYRKLYGGIGPRVDDISTMHRYRDAIVERRVEGYARIVRVACVLFPWHDQDAYSTHAFAKSLDTVGIGALPFLPGCIDLVAARLDSIVQQVRR